MENFSYEKWLVPQHVDKSLTKFGGGDGKSLSSAFIISSKTQMEKLSEDVLNGMSYSGSYFRMDCDIDLGDMEWTPIGYCVGPYDKREFAGIFDGGGHTVGNFKIEDQGSKSAGFFGYIEYAVVQNLYVKEFEINGGTVVGGVVGYSETSTIASCYAEGEIKLEATNAGGIVGIACNSRVENSACLVVMKINDGSAAGGLCGLAYNGARFINCESRGSLRAKNLASAGGFVGSVKDCTVENCRANSSVTSMDCGNVGGFGGSAKSCRFDWCSASGNIRVAGDDISSLAGGFIGFTNSVLTRCIASGNVLKDGAHGAAGGFAGDVSRASIYSSYSCGSVTAEGSVGGFAGMAHCHEDSTNIENCYTVSDVLSEDKMTQAGGFIGVMRREDSGNVAIVMCYSFGQLSPGVKGFTGAQSRGSIVDCVWRRDEGGVNEDITDGRSIQELPTGQFGDLNLFAGMGWSILGDENIWQYVDGIEPRRPHLSGLPVIKT